MSKFPVKPTTPKMKDTNPAKLTKKPIKKTLEPKKLTNKLPMPFLTLELSQKETELILESIESIKFPHYRYHLAQLIDDLVHRIRGDR